MYIALQNAEANSEVQVIAHRKTHGQHLEACCRGISSCYGGDNPKLSLSHATNTSMVQNCAFVTYIILTADVGLPEAFYRHTQEV